MFFSFLFYVALVFAAPIPAANCVTIGNLETGETSKVCKLRKPRQREEQLLQRRPFARIVKG